MPSAEKIHAIITSVKLLKWTCSRKQNAQKHKRIGHLSYEVGRNFEKRRHYYYSSQGELFYTQAFIESLISVSPCLDIISKTNQIRENQTHVVAELMSTSRMPHIALVFQGKVCLIVSQLTWLTQQKLIANYEGSFQLSRKSVSKSSD